MGDLSNAALGFGVMLFLFGIFAWGYYNGVNSERKRQRRAARAKGPKPPEHPNCRCVINPNIEEIEPRD